VKSRQEERHYGKKLTSVTPARKGQAVIDRIHQPQTIKEIKRREPEDSREGRKKKRGSCHKKKRKRGVMSSAL